MSLTRSLAIAAACGAMMAEPIPAQDRVSEVLTSGHGVIRVPADRGTVHLAVVTRGPSGATAAAANGPAVRSVLDALGPLGFDDRTVRAMAFALSPNYDNSAGRRLVDFQAMTTLAIDVADLGSLSKVLDAIMLGDVTNVQAIRFHSDSAADIRQRAFALAFAAAKRDAETLASETGHRLGRMESISTRSPDSDHGGLAYGSVAYGIAALNPEVAISVSVHTRWQLISEDPPTPPRRGRR